MNMYIHVYIYIYICMYICIYMARHKQGTTRVGQIQFESLFNSSPKQTMKIMGNHFGEQQLKYLFLDRLVRLAHKL